MKTNYHDRLKSLYFVWSACFLLFLFVYIFMLRPAQANSRHLAEILQGKRQLYETILQTEQQQTKTQLIEHIDNLKEGLNKYVVDPGRTADLIFNISRIANAKNVESFSIRNSDSVKITDAAKCRYIYEDYIDVGFETTFNKFASISNELERNMPVVFIDKFSIKRSDENPANNKVEMYLSAFVARENLSPESDVKK